jgi:methylamine dehydrogenase accessory protein MauD
MSGAWLASYWVLWMLVLVLTFVIAALARQIGVLHMRLGPMGARTANPGPEIGAQAPELFAVDLNGQDVQLGGLRNRLTLLIFISPNCPSCSELAPSIRVMARSERSTLVVQLVSLSDDRPSLREFVAKHKLESIPCVPSKIVSERYGVLAAPYGLVISKHGIVLSKGIANHIEHLESLLNAAALGDVGTDNLIKQE